MGNAVSKHRDMLTFQNSQKCTYRFKEKKIFARSKMRMKEMIHFIRAIKTLAPVCIHHPHEIKIYWRKGYIYLEIKFKI